jgi:hypothetical protein
LGIAIVHGLIEELVDEGEVGVQGVVVELLAQVCFDDADLLEEELEQQRCVGGGRRREVG